MNPRLVLSGLGAALIVPPLAWFAVAAAASGPETASSSTSTASPSMTFTAPSSPMPTTVQQAGSGERPPVATPAPSTTRLDPLAASPTPPTAPALTKTPATAAAARPPSAAQPARSTPGPAGTSRPSGTPAPISSPKASPRPTTPPAPPPAATPKPSQKATTRVAGNWSPPPLTVGTVLLSRPTLTSKATATVTVACTPRSACQVNGSELTIEPGADVTVTWSAPATPTHKAWSRAITLNS